MSKVQRPHLLSLSSNSEHSFLRPPWGLQATAEDLVAFIGPLWRQVEGDTITCEHCQRETEERIGDRGYCPECCAAWRTHTNCECLAEEGSRG